MGTGRSTPGNGYYGGLQFSSSTWKAFGGTAYAATANTASKAEQIAVAQRTLAQQGPGAWPTCGQRAGLTKANGGADANAQPGGSSSGGSSAPSTSGDLVVDGKFGPATTRALEKADRVSQNGSLSTGDIKALQSKVGAKANGKIGSETTAKLRAAIGQKSNGAWDFRSDSSSVTALQRVPAAPPARPPRAPPLPPPAARPAAPSAGKLVVDGKFGPATTRSLQSWIG